MGPPEGARGPGCFFRLSRPSSSSQSLHTFSQRVNLLPDELDSVFVLHPTFDQGERDQNRGSAGTHDIQGPRQNIQRGDKNKARVTVLP